MIRQQKKRVESEGDISIKSLGGSIAVRYRDRKFVAELWKVESAERIESVDVK